MKYTTPHERQCNRYSKDRTPFSVRCARSAPHVTHRLAAQPKNAYRPTSLETASNALSKMPAKIRIFALLPLPSVSERNTRPSRGGWIVLFLTLCSRYATIFRHRTRSLPTTRASTSRDSRASRGAVSHVKNRTTTEAAAIHQRDFERSVYEPRVTGVAGPASFAAASFAAASAAAASFSAASFTAFAAAEREPRPESRLNWRILYSNAL